MKMRTFSHEEKKLAKACGMTEEELDKTYQDAVRHASFYGGDLIKHIKEIGDENKDDPVRSVICGWVFGETLDRLWGKRGMARVNQPAFAVAREDDDDDNNDNEDKKGKPKSKLDMFMNKKFTILKGDARGEDTL